ncbi:Threonine dehydrogenase and related Zn-dependent dehydrogenase [Rubrobacter radiotolerans]|uniref:Threonine dehydrogenase and related Zn-dependent dehydrogenase n=1 Tax=Rubrobacter radiotolerans TaxID=42256 RepID=A0A023X5R2_RUBRA|nr:zinc-binding alcohol dehydrogenase [Rubrobacter radiotolerans]AHY47404.1 Threonine dehydrogenase and related Zn-dependent dehydrogenase [Rubrobacter radiotolerans]MDX5894807.1 zinc-binding alcohol dehydrogenase [Rubrobacter radiotolerans]SMC06802.1 2-desacetyl-2-hydroxyethyl bacteriochlorophyllide A dehydrogenase [Rubrobacter radiotolerans DSM 5868]
MRTEALWFCGPRSARVLPAEAPPPGSGEVRVEAEFSAISAGTELLVYRGEVPKNLPLDLPTLEGSFAFPVKYGYALTGRVRDVGGAVAGLAAGDAVFVHHPHQRALTVPAASVVRLPEGVGPLEGVFFANLETALNVVHDTPVKLGETVAVTGLGVVGLLVAALLARSGARVVASDGRKARRELARRLGAGAVCTPERLSDLVSRETEGRGVDAVVEASGSGTALDAALGCVIREGTVVVASWYGTKPVSLDLGSNFHRGRVRLRSSQVGSIAPELTPRWSRERRTRTVLDLLPTLGLGRLVSHRVPLGRAPEVYGKLDGDEPFGREAVQVVIDYHQSRER